MKAVREKALSLRLKGYSYNEINHKFGIPKSTLSGWFSKIPLSPEAQKRIQSRVHQGVLNSLVKRNKEQTVIAQSRVAHIRNKASQDISKISQRELLLIGVALYWAEGYKRVVVRDGKERTSHMVSMANSDPTMVRVFMRFLIEVMQVPVEKISINVRLFKHMDEQKTLLYWKRITGVPIKNFHTPSYAVSTSSKGKRPRNTLPYGTIQIRVGSTKDFHTIMGWIEGITKSLLG